MIEIGIVLNGPELRESLANRELTDTMKAAAELNEGFRPGDCPAVNVVFHVPGSLGSPDWKGERDGKFSRKQQLLMVQVAVPAELTTSDSMRKFIIQSLHGANAIAFQFFRLKGLDFPLADAEKLVLGIKEKLDHERPAPSGNKLGG